MLREDPEGDIDRAGRPGGVQQGTEDRLADFPSPFLGQRRLSQTAPDEVPDVWDGRRASREDLRQHHYRHYLNWLDPGPVTGLSHRSLPHHPGQDQVCARLRAHSPNWKSGCGSGTGLEPDTRSVMIIRGSRMVEPKLADIYVRSDDGSVLKATGSGFTIGGTCASLKARNDLITAMNTDPQNATHAIHRVNTAHNLAQFGHADGVVRFGHAEFPDLRSEWCVRSARSRHSI